MRSSRPLGCTGCGSTFSIDRRNKVSQRSKQADLDDELAENVPTNTHMLLYPSYALCHAGLRCFGGRVNEAHVRELVYASEESDE